MRLTTATWAGILASFLAGTLSFTQASLAEGEAFSHEPTYYLNTGYARILPKTSFETNKDGLLLGAKASYECRSSRIRFAPGLGLQFTIATGENSDVHQNFTQLSLVPEFQYGYGFFGEATTVGLWLMAPMGRGAYLKYNDADTFQVNFLAGLQFQTRWNKSWGDLILGAGVLNSFGIGNVNTWLVPISLGFTYGGVK